MPIRKKYKPCALAATFDEAVVHGGRGSGAGRHVGEAHQGAVARVQQV